MTLVVDSQLGIPKYFVKLGCLESICQQRQLSFKRHALEQSDVIQNLDVAHGFFEESCIAVVMRAAKQDLVTVAVVKVELE